jgi:hypothetical protein
LRKGGRRPGAQQFRRAVVLPKRECQALVLHRFSRRPSSPPATNASTPRNYPSHSLRTRAENVVAPTRFFQAPAAEREARCGTRSPFAVKGRMGPPTGSYQKSCGARVQQGLELVCSVNPPWACETIFGCNN